MWSDGSSGLSLNVAGPGTYWVEVSDTAGCTARDSVQIDLAQIPIVNLGQPAICNGQSAVLDAGGGYAQYAWSNGATTQTIAVTTPGFYLVTVTDALGCQGSDVVNVPAQSTPVAGFNYSVVPPSVVTFNSTTLGATNFAWDFNGDGNTDTQGSSNTAAWVYPTLGSYPVRLIVSNSCGVDTLFQTVSVQVGQSEAWEGSLEIAPNPSSGWLNVAIESPAGGDMQLSVVDLNGRVVLQAAQGRVGPRFETRLDLAALPDGLYLLQVRKGAQQMTRRFLLQH
jgi:Secretion system C-terminal sorting domain/PKD domain